MDEYDDYDDDDYDDGRWHPQVYWPGFVIGFGLFCMAIMIKLAAG